MSPQLNTAAISSSSQPAPHHLILLLLQSNKYKEQRDAMATQITAMFKNKIHTLVPLSPSMNALGCKWIFRIKCNSSDDIDRYKACLAEKGIHQVDSYNFSETVRSMVKPTTRIILSLNSLTTLDSASIRYPKCFLTW